MINQYWKLTLDLFFVGSPLALAAAHTIHCLYISRHLPSLLQSLKNSPYIAKYHRMTGSSSIFSKVIIVTQIAGMVTTPKYAIKAGAVSSEDIKNIQPKLLKLLRINITLMFTTAAWGVAAFIYMKAQ